MGCVASKPDAKPRASDASLDGDPMRGYHGLDASVHAADEAMMREGGEEEESYAADVSVLGPMKSGRAAHGGGDSPPPEPITRRESVSDRRRESVGLVQQRRVSAAPRVSVSSKGGGGGGGGGGGTNFAERGVWPGWLEEHAGSALADWLPRDVLTFKTLAKVGQGTFSRVYKASDLNEGGEPCALKEIRLERADKDTLSLVAREIMMLRKLGDHDNVVNLRAIAVDSNDAAAIYLVFEYLPHDLAGLMSSRASRMREKKKGGGGGGGDDDDDGGDVAAGRVLSPGEVKHVAKQLLKALAHCHAAGGMHRDVKCSNLLVDDTGDVKLADFGLSRTPRDAEPLTNHVVTLWYRPPELLLGARRYDSKVDVWSAGCVLAELLWGEPILPGRTEVEQLHLIFKLVGSEGSARLAEKCKGFAPTSKVKEYPRALEDRFGVLTERFDANALDLVSRLLSLDPDDRPTAAEAARHPYFSARTAPKATALDLEGESDSHEFTQRRSKSLAAANGSGIVGSHSMKGDGGVAASDVTFTTRDVRVDGSGRNPRMSLDAASELGLGPAARTNSFGGRRTTRRLSVSTIAEVPTP
jgi:serine/threonine protein kinase